MNTQEGASMLVVMYACSHALPAARELTIPAWISDSSSCFTAATNQKSYLRNAP